MVAVTETARALSRRRLPAHGFFNFMGRLFRDKPLCAFGFVICALFLFAGIFADVLAPYGYNQISPLNRLKSPSAQFWLGTNNLGRDMLSRCLYPITISFAKRVGQLMTQLPDNQAPNRSYRFYM